MIDWTRSERYQIENVEYQIHIYGVKTPVWPYVVASFVLSMWLNPIFFFVGPAVVIWLARKFWAADQQNKPVEYERWFFCIFGKFRIATELFPCLSHLKHSQDEYR